jgi:hypothetical protein
VFDHDAPVLKQYDGEPHKASFVLGTGAFDAAASQRLSDLRAKAVVEAKRLVSFFLFVFFVFLSKVKLGV